MKRYLLWKKRYTSGRKDQLVITEYCYLIIDSTGHWHTCRTGEKEPCLPTPVGLDEAIEMWFKVEFKFADLNLFEFLTQMGVKL